MTPPILTHLKRITHLLSQVPELPMRVALVPDLLLSCTPADTIWCIDQLLRGALHGHAPSADAIAAITMWLIHNPPDQTYDLYQSLYGAASETPRSLVPALLRHPEPHVAMAPSARLPEVRLPTQRETSLGQRRSLARSPDRRILERLIYEPSALVQEILLVNPKVTETDVIIIASRRPTRPELLDPIVFSGRWIKLQEVREALAMNPYISTGHALKLLPTLHVSALVRLRDASDVHPSVKEFAASLLHVRDNAPRPLHMYA